MNKIEKLIQEYCPDGVEYKELGSICNIKTGKGITKKDGSDDALYPIISGGKELMGYYHEYNRLERTVTISRVGANAGYVNYINSKFYLNDKCFSIIPKEAFKDLINTKYLFYSLKRMESKIIELQSEGGVPTINIRKVSNINISLPSLLTQNKIVNILDKFIHLEEELNAELETRRKQYDFYLNQLMGFEDSAVEWKTLGEIAEFKYGFTDKAKDKGNVRFVRITDINEYGKLRDNDYKYIDLTAENEEYILSKGDLLMARTGATFGKTMLFNENYPAVYASFLIRIRFIGEIILPDYYWHFSQSSLYWNQAYELVGGGAQPQFNANALKAVKIPIPPLSEQESIVSILDKFDSLVNDTTIGIQAEIEARRKQYAYYRNKLLTFGEYA